MKPQSIIKSIRDKHHRQDARISAIEGRRYVRKPTYFKNKETGDEYYTIVGAIAFPVGKFPGFAVLVGVLKESENEKAPRLQVLAEIEEKDLVALLSACEQARWKWGYPHQLDLFIGDAEHFMQAIADFNDRIETGPPDTEEGIYLSPPADFEDTRKDAIYLQTAKSLLNSAMGSGKRLLIGENRLLRAHLKSVPPDIRKVEDIPALAALAYSCHTLLADQPWLETTKPERFHPTIKEDNYEQVPAWPWEDGTGHDDADHDDGDLVSTID